MKRGLIARCRSGSWLLGAGVAIALGVGACGAEDAGPSASSASDADQAPADPAAADPGTTAAPAPGAAAPGKSSPPDDPASPTPDLYDPSAVPNLALTFDDAALGVLSSQDPADAPTWVHGSFKMGAITFADVGVRRKGSSTLRALPQKTSLKVKFNKWVKGQKLYGLEELTLNNMLSDPTLLAERLTYHVFRSLGLPAPKANTAHLTINGEDYGIFANVETPDENFLARVLGPKARSLYEASPGSAWESWSEDRFEIDIPNPDAAPGDRPDLELLFSAVQGASNETLIADLSPRLHTKQWLRFAAAEAVTGHIDGYAYGMYGGSTNYFLAGDADGKFSLIPWSADLSHHDRPGALSAATPHASTVLARCAQAATCWNAYKAEVSLVLDEHGKLDLVSVAKKWKAQIDPLVRTDPKLTMSLSHHDAQIDVLYAWIADRPSMVRAQLGL